MSTPFPSCPQQLGLYAIVPNTDWLARVLEYGVDTVQLRIKSDDRHLVQNEIRRAVQISQDMAPHKPLFINDHWQIAMDAGAYGVHLGQTDVDTADLNAIRQAGMRLGMSTHNLAEIQRALTLLPSYIAIGTVYLTTLKPMPSGPLGLAKLKEYVDFIRDNTPEKPPVPSSTKNIVEQHQYASALSSIALVAIGGINITSASTVLACGVGSIAVVSAIIDAPNPRQAIAQLKQCIAQSTSPPTQ